MLVPLAGKWLSYAINEYLLRLQEYLQWLNEQDLYAQDETDSIIALYAIYMPTIRRQVHAFVRTWNVHKIRPQQGREHLPTGQPVYLYHRTQASVPNFRVPVDKSAIQMLKQPL